MDMRDFENAMNIIMDELEDMSFELGENLEVMEYFMRNYGYVPGKDKAIHMVIKYLAKQYGM